MKDSYTFSYWAKGIGEGKMAWGFTIGGSLDLYPTGGILAWNTGNGSDNPFQNGGTNVRYPTDGNWHHYVITGGPNSSNVLTTTLYIDGEFKGIAKTYK
jgi:hypothetical protein